MRAKSFQVESIDHLWQELAIAMADGFTPTMAIAFSALDDKAATVGGIFLEHNIQLAACSSWGEFAEGKIKTDTMAVMLFDLDPGAFRIRLDHFGEADEEVVTEMIARNALEHFANPSFIIMTSSLYTRAEEIMETFEAILGPKANVVGGVAGSDFPLVDNLVFTNKKSSGKGIVSLIIDGDRVSVSSRATGGWKPVGATRTVTKSDGYWVHEIDDQPALDAMIKYIGLNDFDPTDPKRWQQEVNSLPMQLLREKGDPIMRPALVYDAEKRSVLCFGKMPVGSKVRFSLEPDEDVIDMVIDECKDLKATEAAEADAVLYFSCTGRHQSFGPLMNRELKEVREIWEAPFVGILSSGEMARATGGKLEFNAITSCCVVLKENSVSA